MSVALWWMLEAIARLHFLQVNRLAFEGQVMSVAGMFGTASVMLGGDAFYQIHSGSVV